MAIFFTADHHFSHTNIIRFTHRPFKTIKEHDEILIKNWNEKVQQKDVVYHLGDFGFGSKGYLESILKRLNGNKFFIRGNHDRRMKGALLDYFGWTKDYYALTVQDSGKKQPIILFHYPIHNWHRKHYGSWHLHGHCHGRLETSDKWLRLDVGVDAQNYFPISYEKVKKIMEKRA